MAITSDEARRRGLESLPLDTWGAWIEDAGVALTLVDTGVNVPSLRCYAPAWTLRVLRLGLSHKVRRRALIALARDTESRDGMETCMSADVLNGTKGEAVRDWILGLYGTEG